MGLLLRMNFDYFAKKYRLITILSGIVYAIVAIVTSCDLPLKGINALDIIKMHEITPSITLYIAKIMASLSSSTFFIGLCYWASKNLKISELLRKSRLTEMGKYTLGVYILQSLILETIMAEYIKVDLWGGIFANLPFDIYVLFPLVSFFILWLCAFVTKYIQRNKTLGFWLLGNLK